MRSLFICCLIVLGTTACGSRYSHTNASILCAQNLSGEGHNACVRNAMKF